MRFPRRLAQLLLISVSGTAFAGAVAWSGACLMVTSSSFAPGANHPRPELYFVKRVQFPSEMKRAVLAQTQPIVTARVGGEEGKTDRPSAARAATTNNAARAATTDNAAQVAAANNAVQLAAENNAARFDAVAKKAQLTSEKLARLFDRSHSGKAKLPEPERFAPSTMLTHRRPVLLAYAEPASRSADAALSALLSQPVENGLATMLDPELDLEQDALPEYGDIPDDVPLPEFRPQDGDARGPVRQTQKPEPPQREAVQDQAPKRERLAYAKPEVSTGTGGGLGRSLRNLFGGGAGKARNDVAVYDISAARVYMPDGTVLEAHSGIGEMADNPRYAHVRMKGPTPPHTYNLRMREKRFHGVEAIRMLPVDGKNKHGRDGFLTHSYLLRGGRAESHGCVAFKDYNRFLNAFKQGKVRQLVVVPSGGRETLLASNGKAI